MARILIVDEELPIHLEIPMSGCDVARILKAHGASSPAWLDQAAPRTLLLVDDDADALDLLHGLLVQDGYQVLTALSGAEALDLLALNHVQVVVSDQRMPVMSGSQLLDRVKALYPDTLRIILSGYADFEAIIEAINCGIYRFYRKPWTGDVIREEIRNAFRHHDGLHGRSSAPTPAM